ncbi:TniB family NTP-binding protein [Endozoicomonas sp. GU-1]|uniref:TniB family NTP-binding protein n=1 Tax=Endozoicomonas sp. GU-1 TaxID=3009078 RepID=UPI0022B2D5C3|nr:TniB family NTP-binding protein [Endozoicomonas sp. GU-1]WBA82382.1 TniB family NTP-binding protein [Endozoicomonas sp. GU-1]WBA85319.1 TniB family NTP-binding protein [Endozoicomonas sp. GU-1]
MMSSKNNKIYGKIYNEYFIWHESAKGVKELLQFCFDSFDGATEPTCFLLIGDSGLGKSLVAELFHKSYPDYEEDLGDRINSIKPIVRFSLPSHAKRYEAIRAFLKAIGDPRWDSSDSFDLKNARLIDYLRDTCKTRMIIIDEFHHLTQAMSSAEIVFTADWLKLLIKETKIPIVGIGMPWAQRIQSNNQQMGTIFTIVEELFPFKISDEDSLEIYCSFLNTLSSRLKKEFSIDAGCLIEPEVLFPLFISSNGCPKLIMKLIAHASSLSEVRILNVKTFYNLYRFHFGSSKPNPFVPEYKDMKAVQIESSPDWDKSKKKIVLPNSRELSVRDIFTLGRSAGFF